MRPGCFRPLWLSLGTALAVAACGPSLKVRRMDVTAVTDLSGRWNDTDSRLTAEALIGACLAAPWRGSFQAQMGRAPAIRVREVANHTDEHIDAQLFIKSMERALIDSQSVTVLAQVGDELRAMEGEQLRAAQGHQAADSPARLGRELGADFVVAVRLGSLLDEVEGARAKLYQVDFELVHSATGQKAWIGEHQIKKLVTQKRRRW